MADPIERFLLTGEYDPRFPDWDGSFPARRAKGSAALKDVLVKVTRWRTHRAPLSVGRVPADAMDQLRTRMAPLLQASSQHETQTA